MRSRSRRAARPRCAEIVTVCSTDDRYADDVHYMGGCLLNDNLWWGGVFFQLCAQPPDPELVGAEWRSLWQERLAAAHPHPLRWLEHPLRDDYWRQGSVCEDYAAIECPVYAVGGWADAYSNAIPRLLAGLSAPRAAWSGPGDTPTRTRAHPAPRSDSSRTRSRGGMVPARRAARGSRRARSTASGCPSAPRSGEGGDRPGAGSPRRAGRPRIEPRVLHLARDRLGAPGPPARGSRSARRRPPAAPRAAGSSRRRAISARTMPTRCASTPSRSASAPSCWARPSCGWSSRPISRPAFVAARLCDVAPDGSRRASATGSGTSPTRPTTRRGRRSRRAAERGPVPVERRRATPFRAGHRLRLALSNAYWPLVWPSPAPATLQVYTEACQLVLPIRPPDPARRAAPRVRAARGRPAQRMDAARRVALRAALRSRRARPATS